MKKRRILIFSLVYYPRFIGGAEVAVKEITDRISADKIGFDMITMRKHAASFDRVGNVDVYRVGLPWFGSNTKSSKIFPLSKILFIPWAFVKAVYLHKKNNYDAIWPIMASYGGFAALLFKKIFPKVPMLLTIQEGDNFERRKGIFGSLFRKIFRSADQIQAISKYLADWSKEMGAISPIEVVPNGVDLDNFTKAMDRSAKSALRSTLGYKDEDTVLVTASRLVHKNATDDIIKSLKYLDDSVKLLILGTGADEDMLRSLVAGLKLEGRVTFQGFISHDKLPEYLKASDIFIRPSRTEGLGNSFLEAMAAGIPVIATRVGGIPDFLRDGETGLFCEVDNPKSIAQKVDKLRKDIESREYIVRQAKVMVVDKYGWQGVASILERMLGSIRV